MATITLFQDVAAVQRSLEGLNILDFDANRIYELLEEQEENPQRVNFVVENIRGLIGTGFTAGDYDVFSPEVVEIDGSPPNSPQFKRVCELFGSLIPEKVLEIEEAAGCSKDNKAGKPCTEAKAPPVVNSETLAAYHNDMNNNDEDPNNNAAPDLEIVREKRPHTPVELTVCSEALKIHEMVPGHSVQAIKEALLKHAFSRNRVQIVTRQLLHETKADISARSRESEVIHCPIPSKKPKSGEYTTGGPAKQDKETELFFSPRSNRAPFRDFFVDLEYPEYVPKPTNGPVNCTIVRPVQEGTASATAAEARPELQPPVIATPVAVVEAGASASGIRQNMEWSVAENVAVPKVVNKIPATFADAQKVSFQNPSTVPRQAAVPTGVNAGIIALRPVQTRKIETVVAVAADDAIRKVENLLLAENAAVPEVATKIPATFADAQKVAFENPSTVPRQAAVPTGVNAGITALRPVQTRKIETVVAAAADDAIRKVENLLLAENAAVPQVATKIPATFADAQKVAFQNPSTVPQQAAVPVPTGSIGDISAIQPEQTNKVESDVTAASGVFTIDDGPGASTGAIRKKKKSPVAKEVAVPKVIAPPHKFLHQARELFPHVQVPFLERQCAELLENEPLELLIEKILLQPDLPLKAKVEINPEMTEVLPKGCKEDAEAAFQAFMEILPDADPEYLETMYKGFAQDGDQLKVFVANALEKRDYPTLGAYKKRQAQFALEKRFKDNFNLSDFLELFPDPFNHFKDPLKLLPPKTACLASRAYLLTRYRTVRAAEIDRAYKRNDYMLYPACKELDSAPPSRRPRHNHEITTDRKPENTLSFLQQIAFIENEAKIVEHLTQIKDAKEKAAEDRKKAFAKAKKMGELLTCGCCYDEEVLDIDMVTCEEGHLFCKECVKKGAEVQIGQGKTDFPCLEDCGANIRLETLETVLLPSVFARLVQRKQIEEVKAAGIESFETCPFCDFGMVPHPDDRVFSCQNPDCLKQSCRLCKEMSHIPFRCDELEKCDEVKARTYIEDKMTEALIRTCWKCQKKFVKSDGCNKMTCSCGALMCYVCRQPVKDYSHFNGQGGDAFHKCPLYSNNNQLHVDAIAEVARKAKEEMAAKNPALSLKHDPTLILPEKVPERAPQHHQLQVPRAFVNLGQARGAGNPALQGWPVPAGAHGPRRAEDAALANIYGAEEAFFAEFRAAHAQAERARAQAERARAQAERVRAQAERVRAQVQRARAQVQERGAHVAGQALPAQTLAQARVQDYRARAAAPRAGQTAAARPAHRPNAPAARPTTARAPRAAPAAAPAAAPRHSQTR